MTSVNESPEQERFVVAAGPWRRALFGTLCLVMGVFFVLLGLFVLFVAFTQQLGGAWAVAFCLLAALCLVLGSYFLLLLSTLFLRIELGPQAVRLRVPRWRGAVLPWFPWITTEIPYDQVSAVDTRDEVNSSFGILMVQTAYSLLTKTGRRIVFGYTSPLSGWNYPFERAARAIADRAGVSLKDRGAVWCGGITPSIVRGLPDWHAAPMSPEERARSHARATRAMQYAFLFAVVVLSIRACVPAQP